MTCYKTKNRGRNCGFKSQTEGFREIGQIAWNKILLFLLIDFIFHF